MKILNENLLGLLMTIFKKNKKLAHGILNIISISTAAVD